MPDEQHKQLREAYGHLKTSTKKKLKLSSWNLLSIQNLDDRKPGSTKEISVLQLAEMRFC